MSTLKTAMAVILIVTEVPEAIFLVYQWSNDCRDYNGSDDPNGK